MRTYYTNSNKRQQKELYKLRIPTSRAQTSWLCTCASQELNQRLGGPTPAVGQSGTWTRDRQTSSPATKPFSHAAFSRLLCRILIFGCSSELEIIFLMVSSLCILDFPVPLFGGKETKFVFQTNRLAGRSFTHTKDWNYPDLTTHLPLTE